MTNEVAIEWLRSEYEDARRDECIEEEYVEALDMAIKALQTVERIKTACTTLKADDFSEEVCEAINEYLYDTKQKWEGRADDK